MTKNEAKEQMMFEKIAKTLFDVPKRKIEWNDSVEMIEGKNKCNYIDMAKVVLKIITENKYKFPVTNNKKENK